VLFVTTLRVKPRYTLHVQLLAHVEGAARGLPCPHDPTLAILPQEPLQRIAQCLLCAAQILFRCALLSKAALEAPWHVPCGGVPYGDSNLAFIANDWHTALLPLYLQVGLTR